MRILDEELDPTCCSWLVDQQRAWFVQQAYQRALVILSSLWYKIS
jgi:hypothetical protein